jgi:transcriptional regulator GlxA family with amidase domain
VIPPSSGVPKQALELILKIHKELPPTNDVARLAAKTYLKVLLLLLLRHYHDHIGTRAALEHRQRDLLRLEPLFQFIDQNYGRSVRIADAARICAMSKVNFMRFFKKVSGQSFLNYLIRYRIARAQSLLSTTDTPIAEISVRLGFCSQSHFGRSFHTLVGLTPLAYRRRLGNLPPSLPVGLE